MKFINDSNITALHNRLNQVVSHFVRSLNIYEYCVLKLHVFGLFCFQIKILTFVHYIL